MHIYKKKLHYLKTKNVSTETRALVIAEADVLCKKSEAKLGTLAEKIQWLETFPIPISA